MEEMSAKDLISYTDNKLHTILHMFLIYAQQKNDTRNI